MFPLGVESADDRSSVRSHRSRVAGVVEWVGGLDPASVADEDLAGVVVCLAAVERAARAGAARFTAAIAARGVHGGGAGVASWLTATLGVSGAEARARVVEADAVAAQPAAAAALAAGEITADHVRTLHRAAGAHPGADAAGLLAAARCTDAGRFARLARSWSARQAADGGLAHHEHQRAVRRCADHVRDEDGTFVLHAELAPEDGAVVRAVLGSIDDELYRLDAALPPNGPVGPRPPAQRRADALVEMARRAAAHTGPAHPDLARVVVTVAYDPLRRALAQHGALPGTGDDVPAETARRLACEHGILPAVLDSAGHVLDLGRRRRLATPAQRTALQTTHPTCAFPGCTTPFPWCHVHHDRPWETGGRTDLTNLVPLCTTHHHLLHEGRWTTTTNPNGTRTYHPPSAPEPPEPPGPPASPPPPGAPHRPERPPERAGCIPAAMRNSALIAQRVGPGGSSSGESTRPPTRSRPRLLGTRP
jgi:hypothetical protein